MFYWCRIGYTQQPDKLFFESLFESDSRLLLHYNNFCWKSNCSVLSGEMVQKIVTALTVAVPK